MQDVHLHSSGKYFVLKSSIVLDISETYRASLFHFHKVMPINQLQESLTFSWNSKPAFFLGRIHVFVALWGTVLLMSSNWSWDFRRWLIQLSADKLLLSSVHIMNVITYAIIIIHTWGRILDKENNLKKKLRSVNKAVVFLKIQQLDKISLFWKAICFIFSNYN